MSINLQGKKCAVCKAYLFEDDDVVFCPTCGAPHHRDCYKLVGHCGYEDLHGTENEYSDKANEPSEKEIETEKKIEEICRVCKKPLSDDAGFCPYCGAPRTAKVPFINPQTTVNIDGEIEDGITVKEVAPIIATNQGRYLFRFIKMGKENKFSWNWAAFLFPHAWFAFRKMYSVSWGFTIGMIISTLLTLPFTFAVMRLPGYVDITGGSAVIGRFIVENAHLIDHTLLLLAAAGSLLNIGVRMLGGFFGDRIYKKHIVRVAKEIRESDDKETALHKKGGISLFVPFISLAAVSYLPGLIFTLVAGI